MERSCFTIANLLTKTKKNKLKITGKGDLKLNPTHIENLLSKHQTRTFPIKYIYTYYVHLFDVRMLLDCI